MVINHAINFLTKMRTLFIIIPLFVSITSVVGQNNSPQTKSNIEDKSIVAPESMNQQLASLLHDWQIDLSKSDKNCNRGQNIVYSDTIYTKRLYSLPTEMELSFNQVVKSYIDMYTARKRDLVSYMLTIGEYYFPMFEEALDREGLPLELKYLPVIESALNPVAVSRAGATGLWQFMLRTGQGYGLEVNSLVDERRDPYKSTQAAVRYLRDLYLIYNDWNLAIAAYNCGPGNVNKAIARSGGKKDYWEIYNFLPRETRGYLPAFIAANYVMNYYSEHNICPVSYSNSNVTAIDTIHVREYMHFTQLASILDIPVSELKRWNPQFKNDIIPGNYKPYTLSLPTNKITDFIAKKQEIIEYRKDELLTHRTNTDSYINNSSNMSFGGQKTQNVYYRVKKGDNLGKIAKRNGVSISQLKSWNRLKSDNIPVGKKLIVKKHKEVSSSQANVASSSTKEKKQNTSTRYYKVKRGDNISAIAKRNGITVSQLISWNGLKSNKIHEGKRLIVGKEIIKEPIIQEQVKSDSVNVENGRTNLISDYLKNQMNKEEEVEEETIEN